MMDNITSNNNANFYWWFGVVEDRDDPLRLGRCRVRIIGYHTEDNEVLPTEDLPWAMPVMPANSAGTSGVGWSPTGAVAGSWVVGFFADGENGQHPMFFGTVGAIPGGLRSGDCPPESGPGSASDNATSDGVNTGPSGDASSVRATRGQARENEEFLERYLDQNRSRIPNYGPLAKAAIMAQCNHETGGFVYMAEAGNEEYFTYGTSRGRKIHSGYDVRGSNPTRARSMGNTRPGDGSKYRGRGYIQLTWKNNYRDIGTAMGRNFVDNPEQVAQREVAAEIVVQWFSNPRMKGAQSGVPRNNQWNNVRAVTRSVNGGTLGLSDRANKFAYYKNKYQVA